MGQTVLLDRSILIGKNWSKMPKLKNWIFAPKHGRTEVLKWFWNTVSFYPKNIQEGKKENLELSSFTFFGLAVIPSVMILD